MPENIETPEGNKTFGQAVAADQDAVDEALERTDGDAEAAKDAMEENPERQSQAEG